MTSARSDADGANSALVEYDEVRRPALEQGPGGAQRYVNYAYDKVTHGVGATEADARRNASTSATVAAGRLLLEDWRLPYAGPAEAQQTSHEALEARKQ